LKEEGDCWRRLLSVFLQQIHRSGAFFLRRRKRTVRNSFIMCRISIIMSTHQGKRRRSSENRADPVPVPSVAWSSLGVWGSGRLKSTPPSLYTLRARSIKKISRDIGSPPPSLKIFFPPCSQKSIGFCFLKPSFAQSRKIFLEIYPLILLRQMAAFGMISQ